MKATTTNFCFFTHKIKHIFLVLLISLLAACSSTPSSDNEGLSDPKDPLESINRPIWSFTWDYADKYVVKPTSEAYVEYMPTGFRTGLHNVALNLNEPSTIINNLLQGKFSEAGKSTGRFVLNSTIGLFGFFDPASDFDWMRNQEEFGEVLGSYGVDDGPYLVVLGPSSVREEVGDYVDRLYWPLAIIDFWPNIARLGILALEKRAAIRDQEQLVVESEDPYEFIKNAYFQNMNYKLYDGNPPIIIDEAEEAEIDAFLDEFDDID